MPPIPPQVAGYLTLLSPPSLGNGTMGMLVLLSLRWGIISILRTPCTKPRVSATPFKDTDTR
ncbi:MAG: hypothetical protein WBI82_06590 [Sphaerochaeta sp.]